VSRTRFLAPFALAAVALFAACDTRVVTEPQFQPQVINLRNDFAFQIADLAEFTSDVVYTWTSDGTAASVTQAPSGGRYCFVTRKLAEPLASWNFT